jgi:hypothetical protein
MTINLNVILLAFNKQFKNGGMLKPKMKMHQEISIFLIGSINGNKNSSLMINGLNLKFYRYKERKILFNLSQ